MADNLSGQGGARPRSVALVGPYGSGKSTLCEALLAAAGGPARRPGEARARGGSTGAQLGHCCFMGDRWAIFDCPGSVEFAHEACSALTVVDLAVVVCEPAPEKALTVAPLLRFLREEDVPHILFINKIDTLTGHVRDTLAALQAWSSRPLVLRQVPVREHDGITGYVDLANGRAYHYRKGEPSELSTLPAHMVEEEKEARFAFLEKLADRDDALLEKVLEDVVPSSEEIYRDLHRDLTDGSIVPVLLGAAEHDSGVRRLWKALRHDTPDPLQAAERRGISPDGEALAQVCKTIYAGHAGKFSFARIWRGAIRDGATLNGQRIGGIYQFTNGEPTKVTEAGAGDIVALGRLDNALTGATLSPSNATEALPWPEPPPSVYALAIAAEDRKDDVKLSGALRKLAEEDPCIHVVHDNETGETVLRGQGEMHLNAALDRLARSSRIKVTTSRPRVPYKETIRRAVHQHARLKRQTGGHGQFADVQIDIVPRGLSEGFSFKDRIVGGTVPRQYIAAVGEAADAATKKGPFGHPVVDIEVVLVDGGFHAVDSSDMAFKTATRMAMQEGLAKADPVLLEPIDHVTISVPSEYTPNVQRLLTGRRGRILGYAERPGWSGWDDVEAQVPEAELHDLIIELRSQTMGLGTYRHAFDHLAEVHRTIAEQATAG
jgi:elongation factor G